MTQGDNTRKTRHIEWRGDLVSITARARSENVNYMSLIRYINLGINAETAVLKVRYNGGKFEEKAKFMLLDAEKTEREKWPMVPLLACKAEKNTPAESRRLWKCIAWCEKKGVTYRGVQPKEARPADI